MRRVIVESPYFESNGHPISENLRYLRAAMRDCILRGDSPYASHGLLTQEGVLDDGDAKERLVGIRAGFEWREVADATIIYIDMGITDGMRMGIDDAKRVAGHKRHLIEYRSIKGWKDR